MPTAPPLYNPNDASSDEWLDLPPAPTANRPPIQQLGVTGLVPPALAFNSKQSHDNAGGVTGAMKGPSLYPNPSPMSTSVKYSNDMLPYEGGYYRPDNNTITINSSPDRDSMFKQGHVLSHEVGHSLWENTLPEDIKNQWTHIHTNMFNNLNFDPPGLLDQYRDDPSHSFAEAFALYAYYPEQFKAFNPRIYNWMKSAIGREYIKRDSQEANTIAAHVPFWWSKNPE